jgi:hypothetical protein
VVFVRDFNRNQITPGRLRLKHDFGHFGGEERITYCLTSEICFDNLTRNLIIGEFRDCG